MQYRTIPKLGIDLSLFGVGCMRFPMIQNESDENVVDESISTPVIRHAIEQGVNYFDTAFVYSGGEKNEIALGHALRDGYRDRVYIVTKIPVHKVNEPEDLERILNKQLENLETDHIDFYLLHALDKDNWKKMQEMGAPAFLDRMKEAGKIKYACFSFHDDAETFRQILDAYDWDMCQIQFNFMDIDNQATLAGLRYAGEKGIPVVIMEGLLGGKLAKAPDNVQALYDAFPVKRSPVEWAFRWIANHPEVATILSGVTCMEQCDDNLAIFDRCAAGVMTDEEEDLIAQVRDAYNSRTKAGCTGCDYCMPCPAGVRIPRVFATWNNHALYDPNGMAGSARYKWLIDKENDASKCVACGACEAACPQHLPIIELLKEADRDMR